MFLGPATPLATIAPGVNRRDGPMSEALVFEFAGVSEKDYQAVNGLLGLDPVTGSGDWPAGLLSHTGATAPDGRFLVFEVWDSQESQGTFMTSRLGAALGEAGLPDPTRLEWLDVAGHYQV
jgi:hypothetical protein